MLTAGRRRGSTVQRWTLGTAPPHAYRPAERARRRGHRGRPEKHRENCAICAKLECAAPAGYSLGTIGAMDRRRRRHKGHKDSGSMAAPGRRGTRTAEAGRTSVLHMTGAAAPRTERTYLAERQRARRHVRAPSRTAAWLCDSSNVNSCAFSAPPRSGRGDRKLGLIAPWTLSGVACVDAYGCAPQRAAAVRPAAAEIQMRHAARHSTGRFR